MAKRLELWWAYAGELILSLLLLIALNLLLSLDVMTSWLARSQASLVNLLGVCASATGIAFGAYFALLATDFGLRLRRAGEARTYTVALGLPLIVFSTTLALVSLGSATWGVLYDETVLFLLLYSSINLITMVKNVVDLVGMWQDADRARNDGKR